MSAYKTPNDYIYLTNYTLVLIVVIKEFTLIYIKEIYSLTDSLIFIGYSMLKIFFILLVSRKYTLSAAAPGEGGYSPYRVYGDVRPI